MLNDPLRRTGYFFRTDDDIDFTPSEYSYFSNKEDLDSFVEWFDHVQESYMLANLEAKEDHNFFRKLYLIRKKYKKFFDHLCKFEKKLDSLPVKNSDGRIQLFIKRQNY
tara:strand:+ start:240 stop:566 length:327 start_codon:yes stop_codon:yes gene_type:complete